MEIVFVVCKELYGSVFVSSKKKMIIKISIARNVSFLSCNELDLDTSFRGFD
jgi:hypothetical protein